MSGKIVGEVNVPFLIMDEFIEDILVTAFEGGSNYWIGEIRRKDGKQWTVKGTPHSVSISKALLDGVEFEIEADTGATGTLTLERVINGVRKFAEMKVSHVKGIHNQSEVSKSHWREAYMRDPFWFMDPGNIDEFDADAILQYAVFDEVVFG